MSVRRRGAPAAVPASADPHEPVLSLLRSGHREAAVRQARELTGGDTAAALALVERLESAAPGDTGSRAAASRTPSHQPRTTESDLRDLEEGRPLSVSAFSRQQDRFRQGRLLLDLAARDTIVRQPCRPFRGHGTGVAPAAPYDVQEVGPVTGPGSWNVDKGRFSLITLYAGGQLWELAVPRTDVPLVRKALSTSRR